MKICRDLGCYLDHREEELMFKWTDLFNWNQTDQWWEKIMIHENQLWTASI